MKISPFTALSDDVVLKIFFKLDSDPRHWSRLACVCTKFSSLIRDICWRSRCLSSIPAVAADLSLPAGDLPAALHTISVCCPGLRHAGVLLDNSDFGLDRELGPDELYTTAGNGNASDRRPGNQEEHVLAESASSDLQWSLYDDLYLDTVYDHSESLDVEPIQAEHAVVDESPDTGGRISGSDSARCGSVPKPSLVEGSEAEDFSSASKRRKIWRSMRSHLASGGRGLSREQGNKLLASRFREDTLYICDWPGCVHMEEKRSYMLFRGIFKNFKRSRVWRTINDGKRSKIDLNCAYCGCESVWDMHSAFCLRRVFGYHDDGEPVVRAYVCENGHVSGAWTDLPLYT